jgi:hypothetical protein
MGHLIHSLITEYRDSRLITEYTPEPFQSTSQPMSERGVDELSCTSLYIVGVHVIT